MVTMCVSLSMYSCAAITCLLNGDNKITMPLHSTYISVGARGIAVGARGVVEGTRGE